VTPVVPLKVADPAVPVTAMVGAVSVVPVVDVTVTAVPVRARLRLAVTDRSCKVPLAARVTAALSDAGTVRTLFPDPDAIVTVPICVSEALVPGLMTTLPPTPELVAAPPMMVTWPPVPVPVAPPEILTTPAMLEPATDDDTIAAPSAPEKDTIPPLDKPMTSPDELTVALAAPTRLAAAAEFATKLLPASKLVIPPEEPM
jgi:hypothetical protein